MACFTSRGLTKQGSKTIQEDLGKKGDVKSHHHPYDNLSWSLLKASVSEPKAPEPTGCQESAGVYSLGP